jgi:hypothetical protein
LAESARREQRRIKQLFDDNRNASEKALDEATAALRAAEADQAAADAARRTVEAGARQAWGPVVSRWIVEGSADLERLLRREETLIQVTLPPGVFLSPVPDVALLQLGPGTPRIPSRYVSNAARTDPNIQGVSLLYRAGASAGLLPGATLVAFLPSGPAQAGALVPESAVVWWQGRAWAYVQAAPDRFARHEIPTTQPNPAGGYLVRDLAPGALIVISGAQALLSEESRTQLQVGEAK